MFDSQTEQTSTENRRTIDTKPSKYRQKVDKKTQKFLEVEFRNDYSIQITVHIRLQITIFTHDARNGTFNKWDDTISGITCGWTNPQVQSGLVNTRDNTDRLRTEFR